MITSRARASPQFHGFDVFEAIPPSTSKEDDAHSRTRHDAIEAGRFKGIDGGDDYCGCRWDLFGDVTLRFESRGLPLGEDRRPPKGLFDDTRPTVDAGTVAFAHVNRDRHDPVTYSLTAVADLTTLGSAIMIDGHRNHVAARTAVGEFVAARSKFRFEDGEDPILRRQQARDCQDGVLDVTRMREPFSVSVRITNEPSLRTWTVRTRPASRIKRSSASTRPSSSSEIRTTPPG